MVRSVHRHLPDRAGKGRPGAQREQHDRGACDGHDHRTELPLPPGERRWRHRRIARGGHRAPPGGENTLGEVIGRRASLPSGEVLGVELVVVKLVGVVGIDHVLVFVWVVVLVRHLAPRPA